MRLIGARRSQAFSTPTMRRYHLSHFRKSFRAATQGSGLPLRTSWILPFRDSAPLNARNTALVPNKRLTVNCVSPQNPILEEPDDPCAWFSLGNSKDPETTTPKKTRRYMNLYRGFLKGY